MYEIYETPEWRYSVRKDWELISKWLIFHWVDLSWLRNLLSTCNWKDPVAFLTEEYNKLFNIEDTDFDGEETKEETYDYELEENTLNIANDVLKWFSKTWSFKVLWKIWEWYSADVLKVEIDWEIRALKCFEKDKAHLFDEVSLMIQDEIAETWLTPKIYRDNKWKILNFNENWDWWLVLDFVDWVYKEFSSKEELDKMIETLKKFHISIKHLVLWKYESVWWWVWKFIDMIDNLLEEWIIDSKDWNRVRQIFFRAQALESWNRANIHWDCHLRNFIFDKDWRCYLIDFSDVSSYYEIIDFAQISKFNEEQDWIEKVSKSSWLSVEQIRDWCTYMAFRYKVSSMYNNKENLEKIESRKTMIKEMLSFTDNRDFDLNELFNF